MWDRLLWQSTSQAAGTSSGQDLHSDLTLPGSRAPPGLLLHVLHHSCGPGTVLALQPGRPSLPHPSGALAQLTGSWAPMTAPMASPLNPWLPSTSGLSSLLCNKYSSHTAASQQDQSPVSPIPREALLRPHPPSPMINTTESCDCHTHPEPPWPPHKRLHLEHMGVLALCGFVFH